MFIVWVPPNETNEVLVDLQRLNLFIDNRPIGYDSNGWTFQCLYADDSTLVTFTRTDRDEGWEDVLRFRVYDPAEDDIPDIHSTVYIYLGMDGEQAPVNTTVGKVHPSVRRIRENAFMNCDQMRLCTMDDDVEVIEPNSFSFCMALRMIRLSRKLRRIERYAFLGCVSIHALFLPRSLSDIEEKAFEECTEVRILPLHHMVLDSVGSAVVEECTALLATDGVEQYTFHNARATNDNEVHRSIQNLYLQLSPIHKACLDTFVDVRKIRSALEGEGNANGDGDGDGDGDDDGAATRTEDNGARRDHNGMTPLHILAINPYASPEAIVVCLKANPHAAFALDRMGWSAIHYLEQHNVQGLVSVMEELCVQSIVNDTGASPMEE